MKTIIDLGKAGAEQAGDYEAPRAAVIPYELIEVIKRFPKQQIEVEANAGVRRTLDVHGLPVNVPKVFALAHNVALYEPMVYARQNKRAVFGMLSPNFDTKGEQRQTALKIITLKQPYPLTAKLLPDAAMATMLAGATASESFGVGADVRGDFEHKLSFIGALSLNNPSVALRHDNHAVRQASTIATGLTDGRLGNLYSQPIDAAGFPGYGEPLVFDPETTATGDMLYIPQSFLEDGEAAFGGFYLDAARIMYGAGLRVLQETRGQRILADIAALTDKVEQGMV